MNDLEKTRTYPSLEKTYLAFIIANIAIFCIATIPIIGLIYLTWFLFVPAIGFSICNFLVAKDGRFRTKPWDLVVLILACVAIIPFIGWFAAAAGLGFSIVILVKYLNKKGQI